jgi:hypothetical protein
MNISLHIIARGRSRSRGRGRGRGRVTTTTIAITHAHIDVDVTQHRLPHPRPDIRREVHWDIRSQQSTISHVSPQHRDRYPRGGALVLRDALDVGEGGDESAAEVKDGSGGGVGVGVSIRGIFDVACISLGIGIAADSASASVIISRVVHGLRKGSQCRHTIRIMNSRLINDVTEMKVAG